MHKLYIILMSLFSLFGCSATHSENVQSVPASAFAKMIQADTSLVLLDVRTAGEHAMGHIAGSMNIDVMSSDFQARAQQQLPKDKTIALYCQSGNRSKQAVRMLDKMGYKVVELSTGFLGWQREGLPIAR